MRKLFTLLVVSPIMLFGQSLVSLQPQDRTVVLEDFKGVNCGYCPDGDVIADAIESAQPDRVVLIGVHAGFFADPQPGQPDFRTAAGSTINDHFGVNSYPAGIVNRRSFNGTTTLGRGAWEGASQAALALPSPVNLGMSSTFDSNTRDLTVNVEAYYTANSPGGNDYISVLIKESHIIGWQTDYTNGNTSTYDHLHVLRAYVTDTWGDEVTTTTAGHTENRTYSFNVPASWDIANCEVVAFIGEYQGDIYQGREVPADGGTTLVIGDLVDTSVNDHVGGSNGNSSSFTSDLTNTLGGDENYVITFSSANAPVNWISSFTIDGNTYVGQATVTVNDGMTEPISMMVTPGPSPGIALYELTVASSTFPDAPILKEEFHIISGITDLVVDNPGAEPHSPIYDNALIQANQAGRGRTSRQSMIDFGSAGALSGVVNLYCNVSWTFPSLTDATVAVLEDLMDNGVNLLIAGQDIGWDQSGDPNAYGTAATQSFYENYMLADFVNDGSTANSEINFTAGDGVFGWVPATTINSIFGTSSYPEEIAPLSPAVGIFSYNIPSKIGGLRGETSNYKVVYFGVGVEQVSDVTVAQQMVKLSHDWFYGAVSVEEFDAAMANMLGNAYPVPADEQVIIPISGLEQMAIVRIVDMTGKVVMERNVAPGSTQLTLPTSDLANGVYAYQLLGLDTGGSFARTLEVRH